MSLFSTLAPRANQPPGQLPTLSSATAKGRNVINIGSHSADTTRFGGRHQTHSTPQQTSIGNALIAGAKAAFNPASLVWDTVLGGIATAVFAIIPPHVHALAVLPAWLAVGAAIRGAQGFKDAYSGQS